jgi:hypothetical protein
MFSGGRAAGAERPPRIERLLDAGPSVRGPAVSPERIRERLLEASGGMDDRLRGDLLLDSIYHTPTNAGSVMADRETLNAARAGERNIVSDGLNLRAEPGTYVFHSADTQPTDIGLLVLADPHYRDGDRIKVTQPMSVVDAETVARATQQQVLSPPEGHLGRMGADRRLVLAPSDRFGSGGPPYPTQSAPGAEWVVTDPPPRLF